MNRGMFSQRSWFAHASAGNLVVVNMQPQLIAGHTPPLAQFNVDEVRAQLPGSSFVGASALKLSPSAERLPGNGRRPQGLHRWREGVCSATLAL